MGWFHFLAAVNMCTNICFVSLLSVPLGKYPEVELLDYMVILCFIFEKPPFYFPVAVLFYIPINSTHDLKCSSFSTSLPTHLILKKF